MGDLLLLRRRPAVAEPLSDAALVSAAAAGDSSALGALFDRFHRDVWRVLARVTACGEGDLDDLVQMTFLEVFRSAPCFAGRSMVRTWIFGIAINVARHHARSEQRRRAALARFAEIAQEAPPAPDASAERTQELARLARAIEELPYDQRAAYVLCAIEEVTGKEAARALGVRQGTLGRWVHEARRKIRTALERTDGGQAR
jgi:RNA polymerase sigma-70 factor (ECF subfamily)